MPLNCPSPEPWALEPDDLRNQVQQTLSALSEDDGKRFHQSLLTGLAKAGVHVGALLFILGIPTTSFAELTPSDMGMLLRYIRINIPAAIKAVAEPLAELFVLQAETAQNIDAAA